MIVIIHLQRGIPSKRKSSTCIDYVPRGWGQEKERTYTTLTSRLRHGASVQRRYAGNNHPLQGRSKRPAALCVCEHDRGISGCHNEQFAAPTAHAQESKFRD